MDLSLRNQPALTSDLQLINLETSSFDETWSQPWGEVKNIRNHYNAITVTLREKTGLERVLEITFRAYDDASWVSVRVPEQPKPQRLHHHQMN